MPISAIRRWRIRRLYNAGEWSKARKECESELATSNYPFAAELMVRCMYNEAQWQTLLDFTNHHPESDLGNYTHKAKRKLAEKIEASEGIPEPEHKQDWNATDLLSNWSQEGNRVWLRHPWGWVHWDMPEGFVLGKTHPSLLHLALEVLLSPWVPETKSWDVEARSRGQHHALSYSGGIDSTAAMILMPNNTILAYHERNFTSMLNHSLPYSTFEAIELRTNRRVLRIPSNHEKIRTFSGKQTGFSTANAACVHLILLADHLDLSSIAFGTVIENTWLEKGLKFRDFSLSHYWNYWPKKFEQAGLMYVLPINHITEAGALSICKQSSFSDVVNSCLRGHNGEWCGRCWKCFHKNGPLGRKIDPSSKEISHFLNTSPLRTGQHALWALKVQYLEYLAPHLIPFIEEDLSWWERAYSPGLELIDQPLKDYLRSETEKYLGWMKEPFSLEAIKLDI